jgi:hemolysin III
MTAKGLASTPTSASQTYSEFPGYSSAERAADAVIHCVGLLAGIAAVAWLLTRTLPYASAVQIMAVSIYGAGLIGMLSASALYNLASPGRAKAMLRRLDHAMIFVMIAGSYMPFALKALPLRLGVPLCMTIWISAAIGIALKLACRQRHERLFLVLYLAMGWLVLGFLHPFLAVLPGRIIWLLLAGGVTYSLGSLLQAHGRVPFHNAIWHALVAAGAGLHLAAVAYLFIEN